MVLLRQAGLTLSYIKALVMAMTTRTVLKSTNVEGESRHYKYVSLTTTTFKLNHQLPSLRKRFTK